MKKLKNERQNEILAMIAKENFISVHTLAERLYASLPTVRRDLTALENAGLVKRCHGGVMLYEGKESSPVYFRQGKCAQEKAKMAEVAATLLNIGDVIYIDASSTALRMADNIDRSGKHTVITNGLLAAKKFAESGAFVYSTGGRLLTDSYAFVGHTAEESLDKYNADIMFFSAASLSDKGVISDWSEEECNMRVAMSKHAKVKVFMCDSTKFSSTSAFKLFSVSKVDYVVSDSPLSDSILSSSSLKLVKSSPAYLYSVEKKSLTK